MILDRLKPGVLRRNTKNSPRFFDRISKTPNFMPVDLYSLNDLLFKDILWAPENAFMDSTELHQLNFVFLPVYRKLSGELHHLTAFQYEPEYTPNADVINNCVIPIVDMVEAGLSNKLESFQLGSPEPFPHFYTHDQLRQYIDATVVGVGMTIRLNTLVKPNVAVKNITVTVVLNLRAELFDLLQKSSTFNYWAVTDQLLEVKVGFDEESKELEQDVNTSDFYEFVRTYGWDNAVTIQPGLN